MAAFAPWHDRHDAAAVAMDQGPGVPAHGLIESYSVLTRLPAPLRAPGGVVREFLGREFPPSSRITLGAKEQRSTVERLQELGIEGGAVYDGLIALTAAAAGARLVTLDRRALGTYLRCAADAALLSS